MSEIGTRSALSRRQFLRRSSTVVASAVTASQVALAGTPQHWTDELAFLSAAEGEDLLAMARLLFPHSHLEDVYYINVVKGWDAQAQGSEDTATLLREGVKTLNEGTAWLELSLSTQQGVLRDIESSPFFSFVRADMVTSLYNQPLIWTRFGYEGPSYDRGGYLEQGFDDLDWLDDPPADASPPITEEA